MKQESLKKLLEELKKRQDSPGELRVIVDNHAVTAELHPGWDDDGEELSDPEYFWNDCNLQELLIASLQLLGIPAEGE